MVDILIKKSSKDGKKYDAVIDGKKTVSCGQAGASDFTIHRDEERRQRYIARHSREDWSIHNFDSPAWFSRWVLWEKPLLQGAISHLNNKHKNLEIKLNTYLI